MKIVFADTSYWIALLNPRDQLHQSAKQLSQSLQPVHIVTSQMVLTEILNDFSKRGDIFRRKAIQLIEQIYQHPNTTVISQTDEQFQEGFELYKKRPDKKWSLTDCVSFVLMEKMNICEALTYDQHFEQAGFIALMRQYQ